MASEDAANITVDLEVLNEDDISGVSLTDKDGDPSATSKKCHDSSWKGYYCCVSSCHHSSSKLNEQKQLTCGRVSYHSFPSLVY